MSAREERLKEWRTWRDTPQYIKKPETPMEEYAQAKLKMLVRDFKLSPTDEEVKRLFSGKNELQIDNYSRWIFNRSTPG